MFEWLFSKKDQGNRSTGSKMRQIRLRKGMSTADLGSKCGITDSAVRHYEGDLRLPKDDKLGEIAAALGVDVSALYDRKIESVSDIMHILFEIEAGGYVAPTKFPVEPHSTRTAYGVRTMNEVLNEAMGKWFEQRELWETEQISDDEYRNWQDAFPRNCSDDGCEAAQIKTEAAEQNELDIPSNLSSVFKRDGFMRLLSHNDHAVNGKNGTIAPQNILKQICQYVTCTMSYLNDEGIAYVPNTTSAFGNQNNCDVLSDILGIMDKNADTEHFRVIQVQLSRIVIYNLQKNGFDRDTFRIRQFMQEKMDYLFYNRKGMRRGAYFGFNFSELNLIRELTGISFRQMFTGEE